MKISKIIEKIACETNFDHDFDLSGICYDSRKVKEGDLFFCISGYKTDGHTHASQAVKVGASALMVTRFLDIDIPQILVEDDRKAMALISCEFYDHPAKKLKMLGVTGTNGKTTITYLLKAAIEANGYKVGIIGTIHNMIGSKVIYTSHTTPESPDLNCLINEMVEDECDYLIMEVSSHSLDLKRVLGIEFDVGMFTNLTQDHLDFHGDFENYEKAKSKLFEISKASVLNADDKVHRSMIDHSIGDVYLYGIDYDYDFAAKNIAVEASGISFDYYEIGQFKCSMTMKMTGYFNVSNALCALGTCNVLGLDMDKAQKALCEITHVDGRCQVLDCGDHVFSVILDYSHTPDSLKSIIESVKKFAKAKVITVFGCGGDRDAVKRPIMGEISGRLSDFSIITSDNPRTEKPMDIIYQIEQGMKQTSGEYTIIESRRDAIKYALEIAKIDDIIILAGKGHETYQEINGVRTDFDEKVIVKQLIDKI